MKKIINEYIEFTKKSIIKYLKMIFEGLYDDEVTQEFIVTYINVRYYNIYKETKNKRVFYLRVQDELNLKYKKLLDSYRAIAKKQKITIDERAKKEKILQATKEIFELLIIWDNVKDVENLKNNEINEILKDSINNVEKIKNRIFGIKLGDEFKKELYDCLKNDLIKKDIFLDNLDSDLFAINLKKNAKKHNLYYVELEHNVSFPMVYSTRIIERVFKEEPISEDSLKVEYTLLSAVIIRDLIKGNFQDVYITEIPSSLINKKQKIESVLNTINTQTLQDKIYLKIYFYDFFKNKNTILKLINSGFKFVIELDKYFTDLSYLEYLKIFEYILVDDKIKISKDVLDCSIKYKNILEK